MTIVQNEIFESIWVGWCQIISILIQFYYFLLESVNLVSKPILIYSGQLYDTWMRLKALTRLD